MKHRIFSAFGFSLVLALGAAGCGDDDPATDGGGGEGTGGLGGEGTGGGAGGGDGGSGPPSCDDPGQPGGADPLARADTAGALSVDGRTMLMFGGDTAVVVCGEIPAREFAGDTWLFDAGCGKWTELAPATAPSPRSRHSVALDASRDRAILFGGRFRAGSSGDYTHYNDVWAFDFASQTWSELPATGDAPPVRSNTAMAVVGDELVIYGGNDSPSGLSFQPMDDTYVLDLTTNVWRQVTGGAAPPARLFHAMAADEEARRVYVFSGGDVDAFIGPFLTDVWVLDLATSAWHEISAPDAINADVGRIKHGLAVQPATDTNPKQLLLFGGHDAVHFVDVRNDVRSIDLTGAETLPVAGSLPWGTLIEGDTNPQSAGICDLPVDYVTPDLGSPERREAMVFAPRADGQAWIVFGGDSDCGRLNDVWWLDVTNATWTPLKESLVGLTCPRIPGANCTSLCG